MKRKPQRVKRSAVALDSRHQKKFCSNQNHEAVTPFFLYFLYFWWLERESESQEMMSTLRGESVAFECFDHYSQRLNAPARYEIRDAEIDAVPEGLPACLRTKLLAEAVRGTPMHGGLAIVAEEDSCDRDVANEGVPSAALIEERAGRRGLSRTPIAPDVRLAIMRHLLFRKASEQEQAEARDSGCELLVVEGVGAVKAHLFAAFTGIVKAAAGAFFVEKQSAGKVKLRVIIDGRSGNVLFWTTDVSFPLFSLEAVMRVLGQLRGKTWFVINGDLRHWFHQIPMPKRLRANYVLAGMMIAPVAVPMGSVFGPYVGQCCTWGMLFACDDFGRRVPAAQADGKMSSGLSPETLSRMYESPEDRLPPWLPLEGGGGIFVILDNILVATPDERVARFWTERINKQTRRFGARLKLEPSETGLRYLTVPPTAEPEGVFEFLGYQWSNGHHRVHIKDESDKEMVGVRDGKWQGSYRNLASNLGKIYWWARGLELPPQHPTMRALSRLYSAATPKAATIATEGHSRAWNMPANLDDPELLSELHALWALRCANAWQAAVVFRPPSVAACVATDASLDAARRWLGVVCFPPLFEQVTSADFVGLEDRVDFTVLNKIFGRWWMRAGARSEATMQPSIFGEVPHGEDTIAMGEIVAILWGVIAVIGLRPGADIIVVATDSLNAKAWVERRSSSKAEAIEVIERIFTALCGRRVYVVYVPSERNASDAPSRGQRAISAEALLATWRCLQHGLREARGIWAHVGGQSGGAVPELRK